jgi:hypothetical protein
MTRPRTGPSKGTPSRTMAASHCPPPASVPVFRRPDGCKRIAAGARLLGPGPRLSPHRDRGAGRCRNGDVNQFDSEHAGILPSDSEAQTPGLGCWIESWGSMLHGPSTHLCLFWTEQATRQARAGERAQPLLEMHGQSQRCHQSGLKAAAGQRLGGPPARGRTTAGASDEPWSGRIA